MMRKNTNAAKRNKTLARPCTRKSHVDRRGDVESTWRTVDLVASAISDDDGGVEGVGGGCEGVWALAAGVVLSRVAWVGVPVMPILDGDELTSSGFDKDDRPGVDGAAVLGVSLLLRGVEDDCVEGREGYLLGFFDGVPVMRVVLDGVEGPWVGGVGRGWGGGILRTTDDG